MDCCAAKDRAAPRTPCPSCARVGRPVGPVTVRAMLPDGAASLLGAGPRFCRTPTCGVLYYGASGASVHKREARVRVGCKESEGPIPVCYCFGVSRGDLERELEETGGCTAAERIAAEVRAGNCACEVENPAGVCCLGEVRREIGQLRARRGPPGPELQ